MDNAGYHWGECAAHGTYVAKCAGCAAELAYTHGKIAGKQEGIAEGREKERGEIVAWMRFLDTDSSAQRILLDIVSDMLARGDRINASDSTREYQPRESHLDAMRRCLRTHGEGISEGEARATRAIVADLRGFADLEAAGSELTMTLRQAAGDIGVKVVRMMADRYEAGEHLL